MRSFAVAAALVFLAPAVFGADFFVTTAADSGPGSLRQAILDANRATDCSSALPCTIVLPKLGGPNGVPMRIDVASPLPTVTASNLRIQPVDVLSGDYILNPAVEIHGAGDGLRLENASNILISAIGVAGFPGNGMVVSRLSSSRFINVWLTGNEQNGLLIADSSGIMVSAVHACSNGANGIYVTRSFRVDILYSRIGTGDLGEVLPNGANGVHLNDARGATVTVATIHNNRHTGLLVTGDSDPIVEFSSFQDNGLLGIDIGADGPTVSNVPVIDAAELNRGFVRVTGSVHSTPRAIVRIEIYLNDAPDPSGFGEGANRIADGRVPTDENGNAKFKLFFDAPTYGPDVRYVTALVTGMGGTSEFSRAVQIADREPNFVVTNTHDSGAGSLREAIEQANVSTDCETNFPCGIVFELAEPGPIRPRSPLPIVSQSAVWIDGGANRVELNGALCGDCNGLEFRPPANRGVSTVVRNLVINGFSEAGIAITSSGDPRSFVMSRIDGCRVGTDVTGTVAVPNGRGIDVRAGVLTDIGGDNACVISGNRGDAIATSPGTWVVVLNNLIGTDRTGLVPLGNGGNGVLVGGMSRIEGNTIAFNGDRGVSVVRPELINSIRENAIHSNRDLGIDIGNDGPTPAGTPEITSATVDAEGKTHITFTAPRPPEGRPTLAVEVNFYAASFTDASGRGEGRTHVADGYIYSGAAQHEVVVPMNLAGKYISATATLFDTFSYSAAGTTSEFGRAVQVTSGDCPALTPLITSAYSWSALPGATEYRIWFMAARDEPKIAFRGTDTEASVSLPSGSEWWVEARFDPCYGTQSEHRIVP